MDEHKYMVNWADGMKIRKDHFVATENYFNHHNKSVRSQQSRNGESGLLPSSTPGKSVSIHTGNAELSVDFCEGVTGSGIYVSISDANKLVLDNNTVRQMLDNRSGSGGGVYVIVRADMRKRTLVGQPDPDEVPLRQPYASMSYQLDVMPEHQANPDALSKADYLILGRVVADGAIVRLDESFIPPCTSIVCHELLMEYYSQWMVAFEAITFNSVSVINKILAKPQRQVLDKSVLFLSQNIMTYLSGRMDFYKLVRYDLSPKELISFGIGFARIIRNSTEAIYRNEELINYICQYISADPALFKKFVNTDVLGLQYSDLSISRSYRLIDKLIESYNSIYSTLPSLSMNPKEDINFIVD